MPNTHGLPEEFEYHRLVHGRWFFTLPPGLLTLLTRSRRCAFDRLDDEMLRLEQELSCRIGDHSLAIGFRKGWPIAYEALESSTLDDPSERYSREFPHLRSTPAEVADSVREALRSVERFRADFQAYVGWLMVNPDFVQEHDDLLRAHRGWLLENEYMSSGWTCSMPAVQSGTSFRGGEALQRFCRRWRLSGLAGQGLPRTLPVLLPVPRDPSNEECDDAGMVTFQIPDVLSIQGTGLFRNAAEGAMGRRLVSEHLRGWMEIVDGSTASGRSIARYRRLFRLQHLLRALYSRHSEALSGRKGRVIEALAGYLGVKPGMVKDDWCFIDHRLDKGWTTRPEPLIA